MAYEFYLGIDVHEGEDEQPGAAAALIEKSQADGEAEYRLHILERFQNRAPDEVAQHLVDAIDESPFAGRTICVINVAERAGRSMRDHLHDRGISPLSIRITGGDTSREQGLPLSFGDDGAQVSEHEIVTTLDELNRAGRIDPSVVKSDEPSRLMQGIEDYHVSAAPAGEALDRRDPMPARAAKNADLVLAAGSACWLAEMRTFDPTEHLAGDPPPVREGKRAIRPDTTHSSA